MPEAELELVKQIYEAFAERRFPGELFAEEIEWKTWEELPDADTYRGIREVRRFFADWVAGWAEVRSEVETLIDAGDRVVALIHGSFRLLEGSQPLESDYAHVWTVRDGKAQRVEAVDRAAALRMVRET
jgi:uncharacterized protein